MSKPSSGSSSVRAWAYTENYPPPGWVGEHMEADSLHMILNTFMREREKERRKKEKKKTLNWKTYNNPSTINTGVTTRAQFAQLSPTQRWKNNITTFFSFPPPIHVFKQGGESNIGSPGNLKRCRGVDSSLNTALVNAFSNPHLYLVYLWELVVVCVF